MLVTATFLVCVACAKGYQLWLLARREAAPGMAANPTVGMHGALIEPRR